MMSLQGIYAPTLTQALEVLSSIFDILIPEKAADANGIRSEHADICTVAARNLAVVLTGIFLPMACLRSVFKHSLGLIWAVAGQLGHINPIRALGQPRLDGLGLRAQGRPAAVDKHMAYGR